MRVDSYAQTPVSRGGIAHKALSVLMALVLALGLTPISRGQAWATESLSVELAAGNHQGSGKTSWVKEATTDSGVTLYAQIQNMKMGDTNIVTGGYDAYSSCTMSDFSGFSVTWYKDSVAEGNVVQTDSMKTNSLDNTKPSYGTDYSYSTSDFSSNGTYKFYAVATWAHDGYTSATSEPLEFTVTVGGGGGDTVQTQVLTLVVKDASGKTLSTDFPYGEVVVTLKDKSGSEIFPANNGTYTVNQGETYALNITGSGYQDYDESITIAAEADCTKTVMMKTAESESTDAPVLTLDVTPAEGAASVEVYAGGNDPLVFVDGKASIAAGTQYIEAFVSNKDGYTPVSATLGGEKLELAESSFWFDMPEEDVTLSIVLAKGEDNPTPTAHKVIADPNMTGGKIEKFTIGGDSTEGDEAEAGQKVYVYVEPDSGFSVEQITAKDASGNPVEVTDAYTPYFTMVDSDVTVYVTFKELKYNVSISQNFDMTHGAISIDKTTFVPGDTIHVTISPKEGYRLGELTFADPDGKSISSENWWDPLSVKIAEDGLSADVKVSNGWYQNDDGDSPDTDLVIGGSFELIPSSYSVSVAETENGSLSFGSFSSSVEEGDTAYVIVTPDAGYAIDTVTVEKYVDGAWVTDTDVKPYTGSSAATRTYSFDMPGYDVRVNASFDLASYSVNINSWNVDSTKGTVTAEFADGQVGHMDDTCILTVTPKEGYSLSSISVESATSSLGNPVLSKVDDSTYTFAMPMCDVNVKATFLKAQTITANNIAKTYGDSAFALGATCSNQNAALTYTSSDESVVTVDESGQVTVVGAGEATITVTAPATEEYAAASKEVAVTVEEKASDLNAVAKAAVVKVPYSAAEVGYTIPVADAITVTGAATDAEGNRNVTFLKKFGNSSIAVNSETGDITMPATMAVGTYPLRVVVMDAGTQNVAAALKTVSFAIEIEAVNLAGKELVLKSARGTYDGTAHTPIAATVGGVALSEDDYVVTCKRAGRVSDDLTTPGEITVAVTGRGNCTGTSASATYTIEKGESAIALANDSQAYTGKQIAYNAAKVTKSGSTGNVTYKYYSDKACTREVSAANVKNAGTYYVKATLAADDNYASAESQPATLTVTPAASSITLSAGGARAYTGAAMAFNGTAKKVGSTGAVTYAYYSDPACRNAVAAANVKNAGTYYVRATLAAAGNYAAATSNVVAMTINRGANNLAAKSLSAKKNKPSVSLKAKKSGAIAQLTNVGAGAVSVENVSSKAAVKKWKVAYAAKTKKVNVTVPKGTKKGTYEVKLSITANGNVGGAQNFNSATKTVTAYVKVK